MANDIVLTDAECAALAAVDGTQAGSRMPPEIKARLSELYLVERREWPNGPLWRSTAGNRQVRNRS